MATGNGDPIPTSHFVINIPSFPSHHFLQANNRKLYLDTCLPLRKYALKGKWEAAEPILRDDPRLLTSSIKRGGETVLHVAAGARQVHFVERLIEMMEEVNGKNTCSRDLALQDDNENTAFSSAAAAGSIEIAQIMMEKNRYFPIIRGGKRMTPLYMAALLGKSFMADFLYPKTVEILEAADRHALFFTCIDNGLYGLKFTNKRKLTEGNAALQLVRCLWEEILKDGHDDVMRLIRDPSNLLFDAAELGNYEFLAALMSSYPELVWETDEKNRTIIHVAILHRHASIFNPVHEIGSIKDVIVTYEDDQGNNIVHMAAKLAPQNQLSLVSGVALQMNRELVWFEEVKKIVQPQYIEMENREGKTPQDIFTEEHAKLMRHGEKWMKETATACMLVATIIATVVFSAAFSIPGGTDDHTGKPNLSKQKAFLDFTIADEVALFSSSTAMLMFLFILTSRYAENDFLRSLPVELIVGLTCLFVSIASMMMAFSTAFYLSCEYESKWVPDLTFIFAVLPVALYAFLQFPLISDMSTSTFCSSLLFQPWKRMIY